MKRLIPLGGLGLVGLVTAGLIALQTPTVSVADEAAKREDDQPTLVLVDDDDADDDDSKKSKDTRSRFTKNSRNSKVSRDHTRSNFTKVSRDRDRSRGDKTRDWTRDGAKKQGKKEIRDWSANSTNDRSRNDTRR
ncbi:hypothetical protein ACLM5J_10210 [Nocardioides sp. Bht2]|uniref:hypothetical protein n=1 Tax=Nocardioides sp. Bht2 TaxID=3392297 RepID=UPI0039B48BC1